MYDVDLIPEAEADVAQMYDWIARRSLDGAERWYAAFARLVQSLKQTPEGYGLAPEDDLV